MLNPKGSWGSNAFDSGYDKLIKIMVMIIKNYIYIEDTKNLRSEDHLIYEWIDTSIIVAIYRIGTWSLGRLGICLNSHNRDLYADLLPQSHAEYFLMLCDINT